MNAAVLAMPDASDPTAATSADVGWRTLAADVERYVARRVEPSAVEDLRQEVFARVARHQHELRDGSSVGAWVLRIAHNAVVDHLRRRPRGDAATAPWDDEVPAGVDPNAIDPADVAAAVLGPWLQLTLSTLPPAYADALRRVELQGQRQVDAARELGISYSALKSRVQRGRRMLREALLRCCEIERDARGRVVDWTPRPGCGSNDDQGAPCC